MAAKNYDVYFELFGKKMRTTVLAQNEADAKTKVKAKIIFYKVNETPNNEFNQAASMLDEMLNIFKGKTK